MATVAIAWDYSKDEVTIQYAAERTDAAKLAEVIKTLGYRVECVEHVAASRPASSAKPWTASMPDDAPDFFRQALSRAKRNGRPLVIDFHATWCAPCKRLKQETFADPQVARRLKDVELVYVDIDQYPKLGKAFEVRSIPDVYLLDPDGYQVDRLRNFEPAADFLKRLTELSKTARPPQIDSVTPPAIPKLTELFQLTSLSESAEPLRKHFNANGGKPRFVTLLSPT